MPDRIPPTRRPTRAELEAAADLTVPDVIAPGLRVLFCGINPGLYTAAIGHHFGRPGNRFWPTLHRAGITPRLFSPYDERELLTLGYGITNIVARATATADQLRPEELVAVAAVSAARTAAVAVVKAAAAVAAAASAAAVAAATATDPSLR